MARLCAVTDLEERRETVDVPVPTEELGRFILGAPPFKGAEYLSAEVLSELWTATLSAFRADVAGYPGTVQDYLRGRSPVWNVVGRICLHLAENKRDIEHPFAFLATYATKLSERGTVQHLPLGRALAEYAEQRDRDKLLALLLPVQRAAEDSELLRELVTTRAIYQPQRWNAGQAHVFLREVPLFESRGLVVRVPAWWNVRQPPRPRVQVTVGERPRSSLGVDSMLDFSVAATLDGEPLSRDELREVLAASEGLVLLKGKWVEVDHDLLSRVLDRWQEVEGLAREGLTFAQAMRLLAGASIDRGDVLDDATLREWSHVRAGAWLREVLAGLRDPAGLGAVDLGDELHATLRPYQEEGVRWLWLLWSLGLGACLADDMGLGKTIQVLALLLLVRRKPGHGPSLLVVPASLIANWKAEISRFAPGLGAFVAHPSDSSGSALDELSDRTLEGVDLVITSYGMLRRMPRLAEVSWELVVLDEAQAIKNPGTRQTRAAKKIPGRVRLALTGTPVENRLTDLWSIYDFINPGLLGTATQFQELARRMTDGARGGFAPLRELVRPYLLRRLKSDKRVIADLPDKTEMRAWCGLSRTQAALYEQSVKALAEALEDTTEGIERRGIVLAFLMRLKQICNHPSQWLGDDRFDPRDSGKLLRLSELCQEIAARQEKVLVFTQFRQMTDPLARHMGGIFGRDGAVLHGGTPVTAREAVVASFQRDDGPPFFVLSLKAGGTGLNLTAASHVIHFDRWWNPAVESQATDRAYRIGQRRNVLVHKFVCRGTVEERIDEMITAKEDLSEEVLRGSGEALLTELPDEELLRVVALDLNSAIAE
jgi:non-specific serine/threonine protein kinase